MNHKLKDKLTMVVLIVTVLNFTSAIATSNLIVNLPSQSLDGKTMPQGVSFAALSGDRFKESYMAMVKLPAGIESPVHTQ